MPAEAVARERISIHINGAQFFVGETVTGAELRSLGQIPPDNQLFLETPGPSPDILIRDDQSYELKPGSHLYDLPKGTVG